MSHYFTYPELYKHIKNRFIENYGDTYYMNHIRVYPNNRDLGGADIVGPYFEIEFTWRLDTNVILIYTYYLPPEDNDKYRIKCTSRTLMYNLSCKDTDFIEWLSKEKMKEVIELTIKYVPFFQKWNPVIAHEAIRISMGVPDYETIMPFEYNKGMKDLQTEVDLLVI